MAEKKATRPRRRASRAKGAAPADEEKVVAKSTRAAEASAAAAAASTDAAVEGSRRTPRERSVFMEFDVPVDALPQDVREALSGQLEGDVPAELHVFIPVGQAFGGEVTVVDEMKKVPGTFRAIATGSLGKPQTFRRPEGPPPLERV